VVKAKRGKVFNVVQTSKAAGEKGTQHPSGTSIVLEAMSGEYVFNRGEMIELKVKG
jgi:hypothetical protein